MAALAQWPSERRGIRGPVAGTRIEQLTAYPANHLHLFAARSPMTPGGEYLLFTSDRAGGAGLNLFRLSMSTGIIEQVTEGVRLRPEGITPAANDRQAIAAVPDVDGEVVAVDLETGEVETLAVFPRAGLDACHLSASGEYVVTVIRRAEETAITAVHTEGMRTVPILEGRRDIAAPQFSPDAKNSVLYGVTETLAIRCVEFDGSGDRELYAGGMRQAGGDRGQTDESAETSSALSHDFCPPSWMGAGDDALIIAELRQGPIIAVPRQGGRPRVIAPFPCAWARSDAAGGRIAALAASETPCHDLVLINPQGGDVRSLSSRCSRWARPCFGPDGRAVVYANPDEQGYSQLFLAWVDETAP